MIEMEFMIRSTVFVPRNSGQRSSIQPITLSCWSIEEASLIAEIDEAGSLAPKHGVFLLSFSNAGPVIEGFEDSVLGEFVKANVEVETRAGNPPDHCTLMGLDAFLNETETAGEEQARDLISVCEFRIQEFGADSALRFLKESGFMEEYIIIGVKHGKGWRRSRCITTFEGRPHDAATILGHFVEHYLKEAEKSDP